MRGIPALLVAGALVAPACSDDDGSAAPGTTVDDGVSTTVADGDGPVGGSGARFVRALVPFDSCDAFLGHVQAEARDRVGPYGLDGFRGYPVDDMELALEEPAAEEPAEEPAEFDAAVPASETSGAAADDGGEVTGTNVQEAGVDEPDIVKTDGRRVLTVQDNVLSHVDISGDVPVLTDQLRLTDGWGHELFISGDRALLFTNSAGWAVPLVDVAVDQPAGGADAEADFAPGTLPPSETSFPAGSQEPAATVLEIDLSDPGELRVVATMRIEGQYLSARAIGDHVRLAVTSGPDRLPWLYPSSPAGEERAEQANRDLIDDSTLADWTPDYELATAAGTSSGSLVDCERLHHPAEFSGFETVSVIDLDLAGGLDAPVDAVGVLAAGSTVYSSTDRFYVATTTWLPPSTGDASVDDDRLNRWSEDFVTEVHAFEIAPGEPTGYVASGSVAGTLLNQFSLDEHRGDLRIVHTDGTAWNPEDVSETFLTVLREDGDRLTEIGKVGGLGRGEQLYSARLLGDIGFAVTFRQVDPFYVLDLSDPTNPRISGELKIPGFSTYLHPVDQDTVLGIGQDATEDGRTTGLKLSRFDVSDPSEPRETAVWTLRNATSPAEWDHRAFQIAGTTAIVPVQNWSGGTNGAMLFDVSEGIEEVGLVTHTGNGEPPSSDCRAVDADALTPDASDLYWMAIDGRVQICGPDDVGGWPGTTCERLPAEEVQWWFWDDDARERDLAGLDIGPDDQVELCWPDGGHVESIQRSFVADGTLYTVSPSTLQANALDTLDVIGQVTLR